MSNFDPGFLLTHPPIVTQERITPERVILYALGVGATELPFVYESGLVALPTMACVMAHPGFIWRDPRFGVTWRRLLHGEIAIALHAPLPIDQDLIGTTRFGPIFDKGAKKGAVLYQTRELHDASGKLIATIRNASFLRDDGGRGGSSGEQPRPLDVPAREPDILATLSTAPDQAMLYRLSGDMNPLHIDPAIASEAGFSRPILHGLCTFGVAGRALMAALCGNDPARVKQISARFSTPVYPGETIVSEIWRTGPHHAAFRAKVAERDLVVLDNGFLEHA